MAGRDRRNSDEEESELLRLLRRVDELVPSATAKEARAADVLLDNLRRALTQRTKDLSGAPPSTDRQATRASGTDLPTGMEIGQSVLAWGLHAGQRKPFRAILVGQRSTAPEFLVRFVADVEGRTMSLLLPEVTNTYLTANDIEPWTGNGARATPSSAKTRGQQAHRADREGSASSARKRKRTSSDKMVRFDERVVVHPAPRIHARALNGTDTMSDDDDDDERAPHGFSSLESSARHDHLRVRVPSPQDVGRPRSITYADSSATATRHSSPRRTCGEGSSSPSGSSPRRTCGEGSSSSPPWMLAAAGAGSAAHIDANEAGGSKQGDDEDVLLDGGSEKGDDDDDIKCASCGGGDSDDVNALLL